ncbi:MAG: YihY/virulence factor BrkB family protein [Polyangiaceae bacterium]
MAKDSGARWADDACYRLGASLAYYALFSIFPLLLLSVTAIGFLCGDDAARQKILSSIGSPSPELRALLDQTLQSMQTHRTARGVGAMVGFLALFIGASGVFSELESSLDLIWRIKSKATKGIWATILAALMSKALSFAVVIGAAIALLASLGISTALHAVGTVATGGIAADTVWQIVEEGASLVFLAGLFAAIYRIVPQTDVRWRDVVGGAFVASFLFAVLKGLLAWYLAHIGSYAAYGAVGGVLGLLTWIYVASLITFYGAEFCRVYAERYGSLAPTSDGASVAPRVDPGVPRSAALRGVGCL